AARSSIPGVHRILNPAYVRAGTVLQSGVYLGAQALAKGANTVFNTPAVSDLVSSQPAPDEMMPVSELANSRDEEPVGVLRAEIIEPAEMATDMGQAGNDSVPPSPHPSPKVQIELAPSVGDYLRGQQSPGSDATPGGTNPAPSTVPLIRIDF